MLFETSPHYRIIIYASADNPLPIFHTGLYPLPPDTDLLQNHSSDVNILQSGVLRISTTAQQTDLQQYSISSA